MNNKHRYPIPSDKFNKNRYNVKVLAIVLLKNKKVIKVIDNNEVLLYTLT